jgi:hypothetical protein
MRKGVVFCGGAKGGRPKDGKKIKPRLAKAARLKKIVKAQAR